LAIYEQIVKFKLSVRQTEDLVRKIKNKGNTEVLKIKKIAKSDTVNKIEADFKLHLGKAVKIKINNQGKGKIEINFTDEADLERIKNLLF